MELWLARDDTGDLYLYSKRPFLSPDLPRIFKYEDDPFVSEIRDRRLFSEITFENSPVKFTANLPE